MTKFINNWAGAHSIENQVNVGTFSLGGKNRYRRFVTGLLATTMFLAPGIALAAENG